MIYNHAYLISSQGLEHFGLVKARDRIAMTEFGCLVQQSQSRHVAILTQLNLVQRKENSGSGQFAHSSEIFCTCVTYSPYGYVYEHNDRTITTYINNAFSRCIF